MKPLIILVGKDGRPSMKKVYGLMQSEGSKLLVRRNLANKSLLRIYSEHNGEKYSKQPFDGNVNVNDSILIRWGNRIEISTNEHTITYNKGEAIKKSTDKKLSRKIFLDNKVRTPLLFTPESNDLSYPIIARPSVHAKGKNFIVLNNFDEFKAHFDQNSQNGWYYSQFIDKEREFRVHCAHGKVLDLMEKPKGKGIAWNRAQVGEPFIRVKQEDYIKTVCFQALKATKALGLDFAGVDVILKDGKGYVLEANTSPTLNSSEHVSAQYAKYFDWLAKSSKRREHWDFSKWENPTSFAWKKEQLSN